jgi:hypothetical protein
MEEGFISDARLIKEVGLIREAGVLERLNGECTVIQASKPYFTGRACLRGTETDVFKLTSVTSEPASLYRSVGQCNRA